MMQKKTGPWLTFYVPKSLVFYAIVTICLGILVETGVINPAKVVSLTFQTNAQSPGRSLTKRKNEIIRIIQERGGLDTILRRRITAARSAAELESLFQATEAAQLQRIPFDDYRQKESVAIEQHR